MSIRQLTGVLVVLAVILQASLLSAKDIASDEMEDNKGSTRSKASYRVYEDGDSVRIEIAFNVRKDDMSGTGRGVVGFAILNDDWKPIVKKETSLTIGANQTAGTKDWAESTAATRPKSTKIKDEGLYIALSVQTDKDSIGIPTSLKEWKESLSDTKEFQKELGEIKKGQSKMVGNWKFFRVK